MYPSRAWTYGLFIVACLCCSSLIVGAQNQITNPDEGGFALVFLHFMIHMFFFLQLSS
jgi:hypothetical protein